MNASASNSFCFLLNKSKQNTDSKKITLIIDLRENRQIRIITPLQTSVGYWLKAKHSQAYCTSFLQSTVSRVSTTSQGLLNKATKAEKFFMTCFLENYVK